MILVKKLYILTMLIFVTSVSIKLALKKPVSTKILFSENLAAAYLASKMKAIVLVHGGAGAIPNSRVQPRYEGTKAAVKAGVSALLRKGRGSKNSTTGTDSGVGVLEGTNSSSSRGSATQAVCNAVASMEDNPYFNAGYGSVLNEDGMVEMDAAVMDGKNLGVGGVGAVGTLFMYE